MTLVMVWVGTLGWLSLGASSAGLTPAAAVGWLRLAFVSWVVAVVWALRGSPACGLCSWPAPAHSPLGFRVLGAAKRRQDATCLLLSHGPGPAQISEVAKQIVPLDGRNY